MADTSAQKEAAEWIRSNFLNGKYGQSFYRGNCTLNAGGVVEFSAVSEDGRILGFISTSTPLVPNGSIGRGKLSKARADALFLSMAEGAVERFLVYTEKDMAELVSGEISAGRMPRNITVLHAPLPVPLQAEVSASRRKASQELSTL